jgi:hypothetical protein
VSRVLHSRLVLVKTAKSSRPDQAEVLRRHSSGEAGIEKSRLNPEVFGKLAKSKGIYLASQETTKPGWFAHQVTHLFQPWTPSPRQEHSLSLQGIPQYIRQDFLKTPDLLDRIEKTG